MNLHVLVIEDNVDLAQLLCDLLQALGNKCDVATDGRRGIASARDNPPDLALIDIGLPELDGYAVATELRALPELARTKLVAVTGYSDPEDKRRALEVGFDDHLVKPIEARHLQRVLARLFTQREERDGSGG